MSRVDHLRASIESAGAEPDPQERLSDAIEQGVSWLLEQQAEEGYWCGELKADTTLESDYILYLHVLGQVESVPKLANYIRMRQLPDGGWNVYEGGPSELNPTVKAYLGLKLAGDSPDALHLLKARQCIHERGGLERTNSFTRFYLALVGAVGWDLVPAVPPELMILPSWFGLNIYRMSSWTRAIVVPLTILYALRPPRMVVRRARVDELFRDSHARAVVFPWDPSVVSWHNVFLVLDRLMKMYERWPWKPFRRRALEAARRWMVEHLDRSDGLAAIYPAMMNAVYALLALGHSPADPAAARAIDALARLAIEDHNTIRLQPCVSPVWDTAIAMVALRQAGLPPDAPALVKAADWLLDRQVLAPGDWHVNSPGVEPGGWAFEFRNDFYPDLDDTAFVLIALRGVAHPDRARMDEATRRGLAWLISMQNRDGGWGAFDRDNDLAILTQVPFADHNAMIDPSTADVTARVLECLAHFGRPANDPVVARGLAYLRGEQTRQGSWYGRWGVNYIYGTSGVLRAADALKIAGAEYFQRAAAWLRRVQNPDGGFGETCATYVDPERMGKGPSTPSQTAWALIGLLGSGSPIDATVERAVQYLLEGQNPTGSWHEQATTGTGFPRVFYLTYHLYRHSFPLYALACYRELMCRGDGAGVRQAVMSPF
ncbi:MAG: squalene--hopene cyclase [Acidobacteria bacterium]|nr:MAG: squalene--hopene cyclase [Acidobacteriota bacterium]